jgi:hypothetical protein
MYVENTSGMANGPYIDDLDRGAVNGMAAPLGAAGGANVGGDPSGGGWYVNDFDEAYKGRKVTITVTNIIVGYGTLVAYPDDAHDDRDHRDKAALYKLPLYRVVVSGKGADGKSISKQFISYRYGIQLEAAKGIKVPRVVGRSQSQTHSGTWSYMSHFGQWAWSVGDAFYIHQGPDDVSKSDWGAVGCIEICGEGQWAVFNALILQISGVNNSSRVSPTVIYQACKAPSFKLVRAAKK